MHTHAHAHAHTHKTICKGVGSFELSRKIEVLEDASLGLLETWHTQGECFHKHWIKWCFWEQEGWIAFCLHLYQLHKHFPSYSFVFFFLIFFPFCEGEYFIIYFCIMDYISGNLSRFELIGLELSNMIMKGRSCLAGKNLDIWIVAMLS